MKTFTRVELTMSALTWADPGGDVRLTGNVALDVAQDHLRRNLPGLAGAQWIRSVRATDRYHVAVRRKASGLGDWLMTLMALGHASTMARAAGRAVLSLRCAPAGFREFLEDPRVVLPAGITWIPEDLEARVPLAIDAEIPHLVYPRAGYAQCPHMVQGMLAVLEPALGGRADPGWSPDSPMGSAKWYWPRPAYMGYPYAVFAAATDKPYKQWADDHWVRLARTVRDSGIAVARVGLGSQLPSVLRIETAPPHTHALADVCDTLVGARTVVTLEHGIAHLCGMLGVPCHVLYSTRHSYPPERFLYATSTGYAMEDPDTYARLAAAVLRDVATPG